MQHSIVNYKTVKKNSDFRIDGEFYHPKYLDLEKRLENYPCSSIRDFAFVTDGEHGAVGLKEKGIRYLMAENIKNGYVDIRNVRYVDEQIHIKNKRASVKEGDVLISIKGSLGQIAIAEDWLVPANLSRDVAIIKIKDNSVLSEYLAIYLQSKIGQDISTRLGSGGVQQMITLGRLRGVLVPVLKISFQKIIREVYKKSQNLRLISKTLYSQAEQILLSELELQNWIPKQKLVFIKVFSDTQKANRLDAEYFQPKYEKILEAIENYDGSFGSVREKFKLINGKTPAKYSKKEKNIQVLKTKQIRKEALSYTGVAYTKKDLVGPCLKERDLVFASMGVGSLGRVGIFYGFETDKKTSVDSTIKILRNKNGYEPEVLQIFLNSPIGQEYIYRHIVGSTGIISIKNDYILDMKIPIIKPSTQKQISNFVQKSHINKRQSNLLLEIAKRGVDIAIKNDEREAEKWINIQLQKIHP